MAYATVDDLRELVGLEHVADDEFLSLCLTVGQSQVDLYCGRSFDAVAATPPAATARVFRPGPDGLVTIDDLSATTGVTVTDDGGSVAASSMQWEPINGRGPDGRTGWPYTRLQLIDGARWTLNGPEATVSITSSYWGWTATPDQVKLATLYTAKDLIHNRDTRFGAQGFGENGLVFIRENRTVQMLLAPYRSYRTVGIA